MCFFEDNGTFERKKVLFKGLKYFKKERCTFERIDVLSTGKDAGTGQRSSQQR